MAGIGEFSHQERVRGYYSENIECGLKSWTGTGNKQWQQTTQATPPSVEWPLVLKPTDPSGAWLTMQGANHTTVGHVRMGAALQLMASEYPGVVNTEVVSPYGHHTLAVQALMRRVILEAIGSEGNDWYEDDRLTDHWIGPSDSMSY